MSWLWIIYFISQTIRKQIRNEKKMHHLIDQSKHTENVSLLRQTESY